METKAVCVLLMNEDLIRNKFANEILRTYTHQVLQDGDAWTVIEAIDKMKEGLELFLTNAFMPEQGGDTIVQFIQNNTNLPIAIMDSDKSLLLTKGRKCSFTAYVINGLGREQITKLQESALQNAKGKMMMNNQDENTQRAAVTTDTIDEKDCATVSETTGSNKRKEHAENDESGEDESSVQKRRRRMHWSAEKHKKFVDAVAILGYESAVPKKIVEVMGIPGLTRENVASHLQKYRESRKRDIAVSSIFDNRANEEMLAPFLNSNSRACLNASQNSHLQRSYCMPPSQQKPYAFNALNRQCLNSQNQLNRQCLNPQNRFPIRPTTERNNFPNLRNLQSRPKFVPKFQPNENFRVYSDQTKNVLVSVNGGNAPNQTANDKFLGLKFTNDGNKIEFGEYRTSQIQFRNYDQQNRVPEQNRPLTSSLFGTSQIQFRNYNQQNRVLEQSSPSTSSLFRTSQIQFRNYDQQNRVPEQKNPSMSSLFVSQEPYLLEDIISQCNMPHEIENQVQAHVAPLDDTPLEQQVLPSFGNSGHDNNVPAQFFNDSSKEPLMNFEHKTIDTPSTIVPDEDDLSEYLDIILNNDTSTSTAGGSEQHLSRPPEINEFIDQDEIDHFLHNGTGNASPEIDWNELRSMFG